MSENFRIIYFDMGQGDSILIVCPDQRLVMIDCGSAKGLTEDEKDTIATEIREHTKINKAKLNALILTHPDKDHYNQVIDLLYERSITSDHGGKRSSKRLDTVTIENVYFSEVATETKKDPLSGYYVAAVGKNIRLANFKTQNLHKIVINQTAQKCLTYQSADAFDVGKVKESNIANYRYELLLGKTKQGNQWKVSIIAGCCEAPNATDAIKNNAISLVTLLEIGSFKALFLGDATTSTEDFLMKQHTALISNVSFAHVAHHGSDTSSGEAFVKAVSPKGAQITTQVAESGFCLPKRDQFMRWHAPVSQLPDELLHFCDYWEKATTTKVNAELSKWKKNSSYKDHIHSSGESNCKYYLQIDQINPNFIGYYFLAPERMLFRGQTKKNIWQTATSGLTEWFLPESFQ
jgi:beta-lactamase superfamily II metal-dependent hydrolase